MNPKTKEAIEGVIYRVRNHKDGTPAWALAKICAIVDKERGGKVIDFGVHKVKTDGTIHMREWRYYIPEYTGRGIHIVGLPDQEVK